MPFGQKAFGLQTFSNTSIRSMLSSISYSENGSMSFGQKPFGQNTFGEHID
jgi:hypothetical protein